MMLGLSLSSALSVLKVNAAGIEQYFDYNYCPLDEGVIDKNTTHKLTMYVGETISVPFDACDNYYKYDWEWTHRTAFFHAKSSNKKVVRVEDDESWDKELYAKKPGKCTVTFYYDDPEYIGDGKWWEPSVNDFTLGDVSRHHIYMVKYKITVVKKPKVKTKVYSCFNNKSNRLDYVVAVTNKGNRTLDYFEVQYTLKKNGKTVEKTNEDTSWGSGWTLPPKKTIYIPLQMDEEVREYRNVYRNDTVYSDGGCEYIDTFLGCYPMTDSEIINLPDSESDDYYYYSEPTGIYDVSGYSLSVNVKVGGYIKLFPFTKTKTINTSSKIKSRIKNKKIKKDSTGYYLEYKYKPYKTGKKCVDSDACANVIYYDNKGKIIGASLYNHSFDKASTVIRCARCLEKPASYKIITYGYQVNKK